MKKWFVIRADASEKIGLGHVMRCLAMAEWAQSCDIQAVLLSRAIPDALIPKLQELSVTAIKLPECHCVTSKPSYSHSHWLTGTEIQDADNSLTVIEQQIKERASKPLFIMVDHYALGAPWEKKLAGFASILAIDDLSDRPHYCSWLIDQTFGKSRDNYADLVNTACDIKTGPEFALLRTEFKNLSDSFKRKAPLADKALRVLITLGGGDADNVTGQVLGLLSQTSIVKNLFITVIVGGANPHLKQLRQQSELMKCQVKIIVNSQAMAKLMTEHDICIGAAGSTSWERCTLGLPTLNLVLAENQQKIAVNLDKVGAVVNLGCIGDVCVEQIEKLLILYHHNQDIYLQLADTCQKISDGMGCKRILDLILDA
ncbi:MAG: UDP-2,4-diacetamido-2,4,6-trideoxy-beta-L-altropyranose hydrolase [Pseudomonadales bacterium]|nr:UDP-2,4-diacetamido-2,4,6-trideoxy-beta-L-altropyranose hydrolase [Pseudomonadales bacterium]NRA17334.1 UDP-2,4-diacetamido-2,4,6-trideoxy-beta-L-altropyranose hydrolase [Oceanospirillaceae bacterium]